MYVPAVVGVPEISPEELIVSPGGSEPEYSAYVIGDVPVAETPTPLYLSPTLPSISEDVNIVGGTPVLAFTVSV